MMSLINKFRFHIIKKLSLKKLRSAPDFDKEAIYLTFDDGPEEGITEFIIDELGKYNIKGTFFCCGENCRKNPDLLVRIKAEGHSIANHTNSHINGYKTPVFTYINNVDECEKCLNTKTFRPPWGALTLKLYNKLRKTYRIVYWDVISGDTEMENFKFDDAYNNLISKTKSGSIVLFHFCKKHEKETMQILPAFLQYIKDNNIKTKTL